jgi:glucose-1-phosphate adenylyltransferase
MRTRTLVIVLAGGAGGRLQSLTDRRAKPATPFAGTHRLVDFPLSNCANAGLSDVWVIEQFHPTSLNDHLANGRPWDLDRTDGGLLILQPHQGTDKAGWHQGTADALWRQAALIREFAPDALVVLSADAVYRLDYADVVRHHLEHEAEVTMVTAPAPEHPSRFGVVQVSDGRVTDYAYKPDEPASDLVTTEVFVFAADVLLELVERAADADDDEQDLGHHVLPELVRRGAAVEYRFDGYWRDVGTVRSYWEAHLDFLAAEPPLDLDDPSWRIRTRAQQSAAAWVAAGARVTESLVSPGARVEGEVHRSVVGPDVHVEPGAVVRDSVLLRRVVVRSGAVVEQAVLDERVEVRAGARVGGPSDDDVALVAMDAVVDDGVVVRPGGRYPEPDDG